MVKEQLEVRKDMDVFEHDRQVIVKCQAQYYDLLTQVLNNIKAW
jgi:hypothetical protein